MSLFNRLISRDESVQKIPIHGIRSVVAEVSAGRIFVPDIVSLYNLSYEEEGDLVQFLTLLSQAGDKNVVSDRVFNFLCLAEMGANVSSCDYRDETTFWTMVETECLNG